MTTIKPQDWLPHRPPILMIDCIQDLEPGQKATGLRTFKEGDSCFDGHFPGTPILPGVLALEACAQTAQIMLATERHPEGPPPEAELGYLAKVRDASFFQQIEPGDTISFNISFQSKIKHFVTVSARVLKNDRMALKATLTLAMP